MLWIAAIAPVGIAWMIPWSDAEGNTNWWVLIPKTMFTIVSIVAFECAMSHARKEGKREAIDERGAK